MYIITLCMWKIYNIYMRTLWHGPLNSKHTNYLVIKCMIITTRDLWAIFFANAAHSTRTTSMWQCHQTICLSIVVWPRKTILPHGQVLIYLNYSLDGFHSTFHRDHKLQLYSSFTNLTDTNICKLKPQITSAPLR